MDEDINEQEPDKLAIREFTPDNLELTIETSLELTPYEQSQHREVNFT